MVSSGMRAVNLINSQMVSNRRELSVESKSDDFAKMMDESINKTKEDEVKPEVKTENKTEEHSKVEENEFDEKVEETVKEEKDVETVDVEDELDSEETVSEDVSKEMLNIVAAILNIPVEELQETLDKLGMESKDLLDMENVTKLVMDIKNIDTKFDLLVHEDANDSIKDIQKNIEQLMENLGDEVNNDVAESDVDNHLTEMNVDANVKANEQTNPDTNSGAELANGDESNKELSKGEKTDATLNNPLGDIKDNILNEIEMALDERVDEAVSTRIVREIADNISLAIREKITSLEMQLNPESLGKVTIILATEESGITAKITAETEMAKNAIEQQLTILKENFEKQGLKVTDVEVTIASHEFEQNLDKNNSKDEGQRKKNNGIRKGLLDEINGVSVEEEPKEDIMKQTLGNTVSYLA